MDALEWVGAGLIWASVPGAGASIMFTAYVNRKIQQMGWLGGAAAYAVQGVGFVLVGAESALFLPAALVAYCLWNWWNNGGGDGMKRRLKKLAGYLGFGPQAAPSGA